MITWAADWSQILNSSLLLFAIFALASLGGYLCNKAGIINIAIDGQMIFGALVFCIFAQLLQPISNKTYIICILMSMIASLLLSWLYGFLLIKMKINHVIGGTVINLLMAGLGAFLTTPLGQALSNNIFQKLTPNYHFEYLISGSFFGDSLIILTISLIIVFIIWFVFQKTSFGLRFNAVGENPNAVDSQGLNVNKYKWIAIMISGVLTAIAGSLFAYGGSNVGGTSEFNGNVGGLGFIALGIVIAGAWKIPLIVISSFIFAFLVRIFENDTIVSVIFNNSDLNGLKYLGKALPFVLSLITLAIFSRKSIEPKAIGQHFDKSLR